MARLLLIVILLFAAPFVAFLAWQIGAGRPLQRDLFLRSWTLVWLTAAGVFLALGGILSFSSYGTLPADGIYVPERYENGRRIPGHIRPRDEPDGGSQ